MAHVADGSRTSAPTLRSGSGLALALVLMAGLAIRLAFALRRDGGPMVGDEPSYDIIAWNLATGHGMAWGSGPADWHPTAARGPMFVGFLAACYRSFGHRLLPALVVQAFLDTASVYLVYRIARTIWRDTRLALGAAIAGAACLPVAFHSGLIYSECVSVFVFLLAMVGQLDWALRGRWRGLVLAAVAFGLGALTKPVLALMPIAFGPVALRVDGLAKRAMAVGAQLAIVAAFLAPWALRNSRVLGAPIAGVTQGGFTFWAGTDPVPGKFLGGVDNLAVPRSIRDHAYGLGEIEADRWFYRLGFEAIRRDPWRFVRVSLRKLPQLWLNLGFNGPPSRASLGLAAYSVLLYALATVGARSPATPRAASGALLAVATYFTLVHVAFSCVFRYVLPAYAFAVAFAAAGAQEVARRLRPRGAA